MKDVARVAGVSHQTVSRVLNGSPNVRPDTRTRVLAAIEELGYRPNSAARALVTGRSRVIGAVSFSGQYFGPASTLCGVEAAASRFGYAVSVTNMTEHNGGALRDAIARLTRQGVDGVVVIAPVRLGPRDFERIPELPTVVVEGVPEGAWPVVAVDQVDGARQATRHLLGLGHRTVWHVTGPEDWLESSGRTEGWRQALEEVGVEEPPVLRGDWTARSGYQAGQIVARVPEVTAVFVGNDQMALGMLRALREHGRRVPEDISVVGFDDIPEAEFFAPPLTTVRQDFAEVGRRGLARLVAQLDGDGDAPDPGGVELIPPELVLRDSTAPPAG